MGRSLILKLPPAPAGQSGAPPPAPSSIPTAPPCLPMSDAPRTLRQLVASQLWMEHVLATSTQISRHAEWKEALSSTEGRHAPPPPPPAAGVLWRGQPLPRPLPRRRRPAACSQLSAAPTARATNNKRPKPPMHGALTPRIRADVVGPHIPATAPHSVILCLSHRSLLDPTTHSWPLHTTDTRQ